MKVSAISNNTYENKSNVHFNGIIQGIGNAIVVQDDKISPKSIKLVKALDDYMESMVAEKSPKQLFNKNIGFC